MDLTRGLEDLVAVTLVAALAPLVVAVLPGPRIPQVVIFLLGGVLIGPQGLGLAETANICRISGSVSSSCSPATSWIPCCSGCARASSGSSAG